MIEKIERFFESYFLKIGIKIQVCFYKNSYFIFINANVFFIF